MQLRVGPLGSLKAIWLPGILLHSKESEESTTQLASIRFVDLKPGQVRSLGQFVLQLLRSGES